MHLAIGQRWLSVANIGTKYYSPQVVEILEVLQDNIKNPHYPNCRSTKVKILQLDEKSAKIGVFFVGKIYETNFMPMYDLDSQFWRYLPGQDVAYNK